MNRNLRSGLQWSFFGFLIFLACGGADWYVSSVAYNSINTFAVNTVYATNSIVRQTAPAANAERAFRVTTAGTSGTPEPTWNLTNSSTTTSGSVTFTECTGQSGQQQIAGVTNTWTCPAAVFGNIDTTGKNGVVAGDRIFCSSDHTQAHTATVNQFSVGTNAAPIQVISVLRTTGSIPPAAGDITQGCQWTITSGNSAMRWGGGVLMDGVNLTNNGSNTIVPFLNSASPITLLNSTITLGGTGSFGPSTGSLTMRNVNFVFNNGLASGIAMTAATSMRWENTANAISGSSMPTTQLFNFPSAAGTPTQVVIDGVDLSGNTSGIRMLNANAGASNHISIFNSKLWTSYVLGGLTSTSDIPLVEAINVGTGATNYIAERDLNSGDLTTETTITRASGASDGTQAYSHKIVTSTRAQKLVQPFESFPIEIWNNTTGSRTATVELISSASLNNDDVWMNCQYLNSASIPTGGVATSGVATPLTTGTAIPTSSVTWNSSPATPVKQALIATFTANQKGPVRCTVYVGKASTTVYIDPLITLSFLAPANDNVALKGETKDVA